MSFLFGVLLSLTALASLSVSDVIAKICLGKASKWKIISIGQLFGTLIVFLCALLLNQLNNFSSEGIFWFAVLGAVNLAGTVAYYEAIGKKGLSLTVPVVNCWALVTVALGVFFYRESLTPLQALAVILILAGIFVISSKKGEKLSFDAPFFFAVFAMLAYGVFFFLLKTPVSLFGAVLVTAAVKLSTSVLSIPAIFLKKINVFETEHKTLFLIFLIGFLDAVGFLAYNLAIGDIPVSLAAPIVSAIPALTVVLGVRFLKEKLDLRQEIGVAATLIGIAAISL